MFLEYENLTRDYEKSKTVIAKEGIPNFFIKILADLEDYLQQVSQNLFSKKIHIKRKPDTNEI